MLCPIRPDCKGYKKGIAAELPQKSKTKPRPQKYGYVYEAQKGKNLLFEKRDEKGMLAGMAGLPTSEWIATKNERTHPSYLKNIKVSRHSIHHSFTHYDLELTLCSACVDDPPQNAYWAAPDTEGKKLPTLFKKALDLFTD